MRKVIGLLAVLVTATLLFFTQQTNEFMMIVYLLILYLGNSFLISNKDNNDLVPLLTCTEFFYVFDFYLFVNHKNVATIFSFLAIVFSCLTIVCLLKEKQTNLLKTTIKNEKEKSNKMNKVALLFLIIALVFNIVLISFIDYNKQIAINELTMLVMILLMTVVIFLQGFIFKDSKKDAETKKKFNIKRFILVIILLILIKRKIRNMLDV